MARRRRTALGHISPDPALTNPDCLPVGEQSLRLRVCLTPTQKATLFKGKVPKQLGCGTQACVYEVPGSKTRAIKLTADPTDVAGLQQLQQTGVVPKVYRTFQLAKLYPSVSPRVYQDYAVFAVEVERLRPLSERDAEMYDELRSGHGRGDPRYAELEATQREVFRADQRLRDAGFRWTDDQGANIGFDRTGRVKILDVGYSEAQLQTNPTLLEGAVRRYVRRRRPRRV